ncbi:50S ribosomal protein L11 methyltransferase [Sulfurimonas sp. HSL-3221]|uniref:50S ribosomal protein L11 methyltransferase n=1 Tax=Sulfurimonadaceae TaxID=2771471 RepID=UPI001E4CEE48|nr:50S ribosomal protein L11 methyltransferase [Sulfurimonas sp. HSL-3221]UFS62030.1 50S ribosomal protein L11 methyltransferase [Sulfurimonas sp. HSL-3221]
MDEIYYELTVNPSSHRELFADFLADTLPVGFEETDEGFIVRSEDDLSTLQWGLEQFAEALQKALGSSIDVEMTLEKKRTEDWVRAYQESVTPVEVAPFYVHPTWSDPHPERVNIVLDPALAFGTGHHPTTASCLEAVGRFVEPGDDVIDVGCGSGILSIAACKLGANVDACDTDPVSVGNTLENCELNDVDLRHIWEGSAAQATATYDVVIANIVADVLVFIADELKKLLRPGGRLILSGILDKYEAKIVEAYADMDVAERIAKEEWVTLVVTPKG